LHEKIKKIKMNRKQKLAEVLKEELKRLTERNGNINSKDYYLSIKYLETGDYPGNYDEYDLLYSCVDDFEDMCNTYGITE
jgi:hypothetical protein